LHDGCSRAHSVDVGGGPRASAGVDDVEATIRTLLEHGAALDLKDDRGKTPADIARDLGRERAAKLLER
jgi:ankyrin repeat protein